MWRKRGIAIWVVIGVAIASGFLVSSCGGTTSSQETKHYSNATYNFAFDYCAPLEYVPLQGQAATGSEFAYGVAQKTKPADIQNGVGNLFLIEVMKGSSSLDQRVIGASWLRTQAKLAAQLDSFTLLVSKRTTIGSLPAYVFEGTGTRSGNALHFKNMLVLTPQYGYDLMAQSAVDVWDGTVGREIQKSLSSFRLLQTSPAVAASATARPASSTTYRNSQFKFSLRYPASFSQVGKDMFPSGNTTAAAFQVGFLDTEPSSQAAPTGKIDGVLIQVVRQPQTLTAAQVDRVLRGYESTFQKRLTAQYQEMYPGADMSAVRMGSLSTAPCWIYDARYAQDGSQQYEKTYYVMVGAFAYVVQLSSPQADWNANKKKLEGIAHTFRTF